MSEATDASSDQSTNGTEHEEVEDAASRLRVLANKLSRSPVIKNELANELHDIAHQLLKSQETEIITHHENDHSVRTGTQRLDTSTEEGDGP
jgi:hypothetical protein